GPNPYAAMAVILILSESIGDVQALVSLLSSCMSLTAITEYLSHMAMMLLALERNKIKISYRYLTAYIHGNSLSSLYPERKPCFVMRSLPLLQYLKFRPFSQRRRLFKFLSQTQWGRSRYFAFPISIFASDPGTGKTTTLVKYAALRPDLRFLYVAFNNSVACEARRHFPANVDCRTAHSLAYNDVGRR
ncbi:hypothetical protein XENOCAPTIV_004268, partial [Xenoophorus captivus]